MPEYHELSPPARIADSVECFWSIRPAPHSDFVHRVVPDGCTDILFTHRSEKSALHVVGAMTTFEDFTVPARQWMLGVRFRPGMAPAQLGIPGAQITDRIVALQDLWGPKTSRLLNQIAEATSMEQCASILAGYLQTIQCPTPLQRALAWMERQRGVVRLEDVARQSNLSVRQFRRVCVEQTGLSPKLLARVMRFRHALSRVLAEAGDHAGLAADCGYTDQSHFIAEFRRFSGRTPADYSRSDAGQ